MISNQKKSFSLFPYQYHVHNHHNQSPHPRRKVLLMKIKNLMIIMLRNKSKI